MFVKLARERKFRKLTREVSLDVGEGIQKACVVVQDHRSQAAKRALGLLMVRTKV